MSLPILASFISCLLLIGKSKLTRNFWFNVIRFLKNIRTLGRLFVVSPPSSPEYNYWLKLLRKSKLAEVLVQRETLPLQCCVPFPYIIIPCLQVILKVQDGWELLVQTFFRNLPLLNNIRPLDLSVLSSLLSFLLVPTTAHSLCVLSLCLSSEMSLLALEHAVLMVLAACCCNR